MLHEREYARHVLRDLMEFFEGRITYPEIDLRLAGEEAWTNVDPKLHNAIHDIIETIRYTIKEYGIRDGYPIPRFILADIFSRIQPYLKVVLKYAGVDHDMWDVYTGGRKGRGRNKDKDFFLNYA